MAHLIVNSLGEVFRDHEIVIGSVNLTELAKRLGHTASDDECKAEFRHLAEATLSDLGCAFVLRVWALQGLDAINYSDRFRIYGSDGRILLVTEFCAPDENNEAFWERVDEAAKATGGELEDMWVEKGDRQVALNIDVTEVADLSEAIKRATDATDAVWLTQGVSVI